MHYLKILARKKITKVKVLSISTIFILLSLVVNSCSSKPDNEIEFWTMQLKPDFTEYFDELISDFEARDTNLHKDTATE